MSPKTLLSNNDSRMTIKTSSKNGGVIKLKTRNVKLPSLTSAVKVKSGIKTPKYNLDLILAPVIPEKSQSPMQMRKRSIEFEEGEDYFDKKTMTGKCKTRTNSPIFSPTRS